MRIPNSQRTAFYRHHAVRSFMAAHRVPLEFLSTVARVFEVASDSDGFNAVVRDDVFRQATVNPKKIETAINWLVQNGLVGVEDRTVWFAGKERKKPVLFLREDAQTAVKSLVKQAGGSTESPVVTFIQGFRGVRNAVRKLPERVGMLA